MQKVCDPGNSRQLDESFRSFYRAFNMFNRIAWGNTLPPCVLSFYRRKNTRTLAYASNVFPEKISFNISNCLRLPESFLWGVLAHEMIHIWQFTKGRRGGHGADFRNEMLRIGVDEKYGVVIPGTAGDYIFTLNEISPVNLYDALRTIAGQSSLRTPEFAEQFIKNNH